MCDTIARAGFYQAPLPITSKHHVVADAVPVLSMILETSNNPTHYVSRQYHHCANFLNRIYPYVSLRTLRNSSTKRSTENRNIHTKESRVHACQFGVLMSWRRISGSGSGSGNS